MHCGSHGRCTEQNVFLAGKFLRVRSDTFAVGCIDKKRIEENANVSFLRQTIRRALVVLRPVIHSLRELLNFGLTRSMVTLE